MTRRLRPWLVLLLLLLASTVSVACQARLAGYFDQAIGNTGDRAAQMAATANHANVTMSVQYWREADWQAARAAGQRVILIVPDELFWQVESGGLVSADLGMWCRDEDWCHRTLADWVALVEAHHDQVEAILIADEKDCNDGGTRFPYWTVASCQRAAQKILALHSAVKAALPWVKTWVNYTAAWAYYFRLAQQRGQHPSVYGVSLPPADWISLDCYTPFARCFGSESVSALYGAWKPWMPSSQRFVLLPRAFSGSYLGWNPSTAELATMAGQYLAYAQAEPRVEVFLPFIWRSVSGVGWGAMDVPAIASTYVGLGQQITGRRLSAPRGVRIEREGVPCVDGGVVCPG